MIGRNFLDLHEILENTWKVLLEKSSGIFKFFEKYLSLPGDKSFNTETAFLADKTFLQLSLLIVITVWCIFCLHWFMSCAENCASWFEPVGVGPIKYLEKRCKNNKIWENLWKK